ncbi:MAG: DUF1631 family protein, partial [Gammaproteobacteria bacterium]
MSTGGRQSGGAEQRRYARVPIKLDGLLAIDGQQPVQCTVRDFCLGGMFISADPAAYATVKPQTPAVLYFALIVDGEQHDYQVGLIIARAVAKGIGVSFADPAPATLELLSRLAAPQGMPSLPDGAAGPGETQDGFAPEFATIEGPLKALVHDEVTRLASVFLDAVDEQLFVSARDAGNNVDETRFLDGQREMRERQEVIREQVPEKIRLGVSIIGNPLSERNRDPSSIGLSDLSLIEKDEFEEFLVISEMVSELEPEFSEPLFELGRRFSYLANREVEVSALPVGPSVMCTALSDNLKGLQSHGKVVKAIYGVLHRVMSRELGAFYQALNEFFVANGVLPVIDRDKPVIKRSISAEPSFDAPLPGEGGAAAEEEALEELMPGPENYQGR